MLAPLGKPAGALCYALWSAGAAPQLVIQFELGVDLVLLTLLVPTPAAATTAAGSCAGQQTTAHVSSVAKLL